jgi:MinD-like ATPase involved in chromosome partitioning or flagellar assembly/ActR/RegA family two-component response regulator
MDDNNIFVLLIQNNPAEAGLIRRALARHGDGVFKLQCVETLPTALARMGGGGVDIVMLDLSMHTDRSNDGLAGFQQVHQAAPQVPIIVLYDPHDEGLALRAMCAGAADYLLKEGCSEGISLVIRSAIELGRKQFEPGKPSVGLRQTGGVISFIGAKGGVGTTTVALNVASVLAKRSKVILVEMRPVFGTLVPYLKPYGQIRNLSHLLRSESAEIAPMDATACLWPCKNVPGLSVLFGPQSAAEGGELLPDRVKKLIRVLAGLANYVVLDLPASLSDANRAAAQVSGRLVLVVERDPVCAQAAQSMARAMEGWEGAPQPIEIILVNRASLSTPMPLAEIEALLGFPALGVVPPGPDVCHSAQRAHAPVVAVQPDSLVADSLIALAEKCASYMRTVPMVA